MILTQLFKQELQFFFNTSCLEVNSKGHQSLGITQSERTFNAVHCFSIYTY